MTEEADLQAKIAAISGKINQHKQHQPPHYWPSNQYSPQPYHGYERWSPYGRGAYAGHQPLHKNRSLVLNATNTPTPTDSGDQVTVPAGANASVPSSNSSEALVRAHSTSKQLMTKETFDREMDAHGQRRAAKRQKQNREETTRLMRHFKSSMPENNRELDVDGIRFRLKEDGSKLVRVSDDSSKATPKKTAVAGVTFLRTKHGNLVRAIAVRNIARIRSNKPECELFTKDGTCPFGVRCRFSHDPDKVAICKAFLHTGSCPRGKNCDMSHEMSYHRVPACTFFARGNCTNDACRFPHVHVSAAAHVCRPFATNGYCAKGPDCDKRHVFECPDFANHGHCVNRENGKCQLPHPDRASILRKAAHRQTKVGSDDESDMSSDDHQDNHDDSIDDVDSDDAVDIITGGSGDDTHELIQQRDFVGFS